MVGITLKAAERRLYCTDCSVCSVLAQSTLMLMECLAVHTSSLRLSMLTSDYFLAVTINAIFCGKTISSAFM